VPRIYPIYKVGKDVTVIGEVCRVGLQGIVVWETKAMVVIVDDAAFCHWLSLEDVTSCSSQRETIVLNMMLVSCLILSA
jgi:hypothetical protein